MKYDIKSLKLAKKGKLRIEWAWERMPVLQLITKRFKRYIRKYIHIIIKKIRGIIDAVSIQVRKAWQKANTLRG